MKNGEKGICTRPLKQRICKHQSSLRRKQWTYAVALLQILGDEQIFLPGGGDVEGRLCQRELYWIHAVGSLQPPGLNKGFHMSVALEINYRRMLCI